MDKALFMAEYSGIYEHSPWVAAQAWARGLRCATVQDLHTAFCEVIRGAGHKRQLELLRAHPQLAGAIASGEDLTPESRDEQLGAGLDQCSVEEFEEFSHLNDAYSEKFGFPFIIAVKGLGREQILESFRKRLANSPEEEFDEALEQVLRIGKFRMLDLAAKEQAGDEG